VVSCVMASRRPVGGAGEEWPWEVVEREMRADLRRICTEASFFQAAGHHFDSAFRAREPYASLASDTIRYFVDSGHRVCALLHYFGDDRQATRLLALARALRKPSSVERYGAGTGHGVLIVRMNSDKSRGRDGHHGSRRSAGVGGGASHR
jgi:hypothetical protein